MTTSSFLGQYFQPPTTSLGCVLQVHKDVIVPPVTKLACTLGPMSRDVATLEGLLQAGMSMARFDFSYGDVAYHQETLNNLRTAMNNTRKMCATMIDTVGPETFIVNRPHGSVIEIQAGQTLVLTSDQSQPATSQVLPLSHPVPAACEPGMSVFVGRYLFTGSEMNSVYLTVQKVEPGRLICKCENACNLEGVLITANFNQLKTSDMPILTEQDKEVIRTFGVSNEIDFVSLAFTRTERDVLEVRHFLNSCGLQSTQIIGKIENREGLNNFAAIMSVSDAIIFSRGNLGLCIDAEKMFLCQKVVLRACNMTGKPVMVTRVVDTMTDAPRPTRAEATDVANLVLDGADGILLGSETFRGKDPVGTAKTVMDICKQGEQCFNSASFYRTVMDFMGANGPAPNMDHAEALCSSAVRAADKICAKLLIVFTVTGRTARMMAKYKPSMPIVAVVCKDQDTKQSTHDNPVSCFDGGYKKVVVPFIKQDGLRWDKKGDMQARQCLMYRGVLPMLADPTIGSPGGAILEYAIAQARVRGLVQTGDRVVVMQCPRKTGFNHIMEECGGIKLITIDDELRLAYSHEQSGLEHVDSSSLEKACMIGSMDNLVAMQAKE